MRNICKKLLFSGLLAVAGGAFAASIDGGYQCTTTYPNGSKMTDFKAVLTNAAGTTALGSLRLEQNTDSWGYHTGLITLSTSSGASFNVNNTDGTQSVLVYDAIRLTLSGLYKTTRDGVLTISSLSCSKVW